MTDAVPHPRGRERHLEGSIGVDDMAASALSL